MSADLYPVRVYHDGNRPGIVRINGIQRHIGEVPSIPGLPALGMIDFAPATHTYELRPEYEKSRPMRAAEIAAVHDWLGRIERGEA